jgi:peptidoglycan/LPS O-acetylase OafA/YrhL
VTAPSVAAPSRPPAGARQGTDRKQESANLDLLRSLALLWVLAVHLFGFLGVIPQGSALMRVGQFGLRLFFVHTTLVLMRSLERRYRGEGWRDLFGNFLLRRCFRIYPLSVLIVLVTFAFRIPAANVGVWSIHHIAVGPGGLLANLLLVQNLTYTPSIVGQMWSLPLEMQMYVLLPALFLLARRAPSVRPLLVLWVAAVGLALVQPMISGRLSLGQFVPSFLPGIVAYRLAGTIRPRWPFVAWPLTLCALAAVFSLSLPEEHGWVLCLVTGLAIPRFKEPEQEWLRRGAQLVARYSYGIYLTHLFALWLAFVRLAALPMAGRWVVFLVMLIALPVLLYHAIEAPMIAYGARLADRWFARRASPAVAV